VRIEINQELEPGDDTLELPWASPADPSLRYCDLRLFPQKIAGLPECRDYPALADCLAKLNASSSPFRSAKCDVWCTTRLAEDERMDFGLPFKTGSYLDLVFNDPEIRKDLDAHGRFAEKLQRALSALRVPAQMEIVLRRCLFHPQEVWGYALTLFLHAYGPTQDEAVSQWSRAMAALAQALEETR
jgi:hypothetical protein